jgi:hypothetical protein
MPRHEFDILLDKDTASKIFYWGRVVSISDDFESRRIKVFIPEIDSKLGDFEQFSISDKKSKKVWNSKADGADSLVKMLPECYSASPAYFHYVPQIGERVLVFMDRYHNTKIEGQQEKRYYLTVSISQPQRIDFDPYDTTADALESDGKTVLENPISRIPEAKGAYPTKDVIGLIGRKNTDVLLKDSEVLLRAGKHEKDNNTVFNRKDPAYVQLRHGLKNSSKESKKKIVTEVEIIPPDHLINIFIDTNHNLEITVFLFRDNTIVDSFVGAYSTRESVLSMTKAKIKELQDKYKKWKLLSTDADIQKLQKDFSGNQRFVRKEVEIKEQNEFDQFAGSVINMVAEKINLLSHKSAFNFNLTDPEQMITPEIQLEINSKAHPMVHGDTLYEFLTLVKQYILTHVHPYAGLPADPDEIVQEIRKYDLNNLLDKNIRIG